MFYIRIIYTDCSRVYRIGLLRHVLYHSVGQLSLRKRLVNWRWDRSVVVKLTGLYNDSHLKDDVCVGLCVWCTTGIHIRATAFKLIYE